MTTCKPPVSKRFEIEATIRVRLAAEMIRANQPRDCEMCANAQGGGLDVESGYQHLKKEAFAAEDRERKKQNTE